MSEIKEGFFPHKEYRYNADEDAYELMSRWTSADTVFLDDDTNVSNALSGMISDDGVSEDAAWSSSKVSTEIDGLSDALEKKCSLYSAVLYQDGIEGDIWEIPIFEGLFTLSRNTHCIMGIIDRWGNITYIKEEENSFATVSIIAADDQRKVRFKNNTNYSILAMYMPSVRYYS